jgi:hypothetical protein
MFRSRISSRSKAVTLTALAPVLAFSLAACGSGSSGSPASASTPSATGAPGPGGARGGFGGVDFTKIQACLKAAGISLPTRTDFPRPSGSFSPGPRPSGVGPSGVRPSGGNFRGGADRGLFASAQVQAALKACGITVPTGGPRPNATPTS